MIATAMSNRHLRVLIGLLALVLTVSAFWLQRPIDAPAHAAAAFAIWWLALPLLTLATAPRREEGPITISRAGFGAVLAVTWLHGIALVAALTAPVLWWQRAPSLPAALAIAVAATVVLLAPWRWWPALALPLFDRAADGARGDGVRRRIARAFRAAAALTGRGDVFIDAGLPVLLLHSLLLLLPGLLWWRPESIRSIGMLAAAAFAACLAAWLGQRWIQSRVAALLQAQDMPDAMPEAAPEPIPDSALARAAALRAALRDGHVDRALAIIGAGVDVTAPAFPDEADQRDALTVAATLNDSRPLRAMIAGGADVNHRWQQLTPLLAACRDSYYGRAEIVLALIANGADAGVRDESGRTPLHHAALGVEPGVAVMLLDAGAPVDAVDDDGYTPLARACSAGNDALAALLLERRAAPAVPGAIPALCAAAAGTADAADIVRRLLQAKAAIDARDGSGRTALHHAVAGGHVEAVRALLAAGAGIDIRDGDDRVPAQLLARGTDAGAAIARLLIAAGADAAAIDTPAASPSSPAPIGSDGPAMGATRTAPVPADAQTRAQLALTAVEQGAGRALSEALSAGLPVDARLPDGQLLVAAAIDGWPATQPLLAALPTAGVSVAGGAWLSRLLAVTGGSAPALEAIALAWLEAGADAFAPAADAAPLQQAVARGFERLAAALLQRGADARRADRAGITPLHLALRHDDERALRLSLLLLRHGADPEAPAGSGETPLGLALDGDRGALADWLRWRRWRLPGRRLAGHDLVAAAQSGDVAAVRRLLALGLSIEARDRQGCTALIRACGGGHPALVEELLDRGADAGARADSGATALSAAIIAGQADIVHVLLARGVAPDQRLINGTTALIVAAACGAAAAIAPLIGAGARIEARDQAGNTALHAAAGFAFAGADAAAVRSILFALLEAGADIDAVNDIGATPLHVACGAGAATPPAGAGIEAAMDVLLARSAAVSAVDRHGRTPLHYAAAHGQLAAVRRLLDRGAEAAHFDRAGMRAEDYAARHGYTDVAQALRPAAPSTPLPLRPA